MKQDKRCKEGNRSGKRWIAKLGTGCILSGLSYWGGFSAPVLAVEQVIVQMENRSTVSVSVTDLTDFAATGTPSPSLEPVAQALGEHRLSRLQQALQYTITADPFITDYIIDSPLVSALLERMGAVFHTDAGENGGVYLQRAFVDSALQDGQLSVLSVLRHFAGEELQIEISALNDLMAQYSLMSDYRTAAVQAVRQHAEIALAATADTPGAREDLADGSTPPTAKTVFNRDLQSPGPVSFTRQEMTVSVPVPPRPTPITTPYFLTLDLFVPEAMPTPVPLVIMSHGFGATRENYAYLAAHLASHGFAVAMLDHEGSALQYRDLFLGRTGNTLLRPAEYVSRAMDISGLLDALEDQVANDPELVQHIDPQRIGVFGNSIGGTTALAVAGADINPQRLQQVCSPNNPSLNLSLVLQCAAQQIPPSHHTLADPRIRATIAAYPFNSAIFGPQGMAQIEVPVLLVSGSNDIITAPVQEQIHPFVWLQSPHKYLALLEGGTHFSTSDDAFIADFPAFLRGPSTALGRRYLQALSVAFFQVYLKEDESFTPYLTARYGQAISEPIMPLWLISDLTEEQLSAAYGQEIPVWSDSLPE